MLTSVYTAGRLGLQHHWHVQDSCPIDPVNSLPGCCPGGRLTQGLQGNFPGAVFIQERAWETMFPPGNLPGFQAPKGLKDRESTYSICVEPYPLDSRAHSVMSEWIDRVAEWQRLLAGQGWSGGCIEHYKRDY